MCVYIPGRVVGGFAGLMGGGHIHSGTRVVIRRPKPSTHIVAPPSSLGGLLPGYLQLLGLPLHLITSLLLLRLEGGRGREGGREGEGGRGGGGEGGREGGEGGRGGREGREGGREERERRVGVNECVRVKERFDSTSVNICMCLHMYKIIKYCCI